MKARPRANGESLACKDIQYGMTPGRCRSLYGVHLWVLALAAHAFCQSSSLVVTMHTDPPPPPPLSLPLPLSLSLSLSLSPPTHLSRWIKQDASVSSHPSARTTSAPARRATATYGCSTSVLNPFSCCRTMRTGNARAPRKSGSHNLTPGASQCASTRLRR